MLTKETLILLGKYLISNQIEEGPTRGFIRRYRSNFGKGGAYPEITGYAASSFSKLYDLEKNEKYLTCALKAADALIRYQEPNGAIATVVNIKGRSEDIVHIFDLAIIARGILDVFERSGKIHYLNSAIKIMAFIKKFYVEKKFPSVVDLKGACRKSEFPEYFWINTKVIIPLYQLYQITGDESLLKSAEKIFTALQESFDERGFFGSDNKLAYNRTHYHAYALYGITYLHRWTLEDKYIDLIEKGTNFLRAMVSAEGGVYSEFSKHGEPRYSSGYDIPVTAQLAELIFYLNSVGVICQGDDLALHNLENFLSKKIVRSTWNKKIEGGLPFLEKGRLLKYTVPWGVEFSIHYMHDKKYLKIKR